MYFSTEDTGVDPPHWSWLMEIAHGGDYRIGHVLHMHSVLHMHRRDFDCLNKGKDNLFNFDAPFSHELFEVSRKSESQPTSEAELRGAATQVDFTDAYHGRVVDQFKIRDMLRDGKTIFLVIGRATCADQDWMTFRDQVGVKPEEDVIRRKFGNDLIMMPVDLPEPPMGERTVMIKMKQIKLQDQVELREKMKDL